MMPKPLYAAVEYAKKCHSRTNHTYNGHDYEFHLQMVASIAEDYLDLIPDVRFRQTVLAACWCHDIIEDTRQTYNDVKEVVGEEVADIVYALTNEKGKNRTERANDKYYAGIKAVRYADFVKVCDRIANMQYSIEQKSSMAKKYAKEYPEFKEKLYRNGLKPMFDHIERMISLVPKHLIN